MRYAGNKITVIGLARSGFAAAKFLLARKARVRVTESCAKRQILESAEYLRGLGAEVETGVHTEDFVTGSRFVVTSPGIPRKSPPLVWAARKRIPVLSEIELAWRSCPGRIVGITGSNGKTTTSHLINRMLREARRPAVLCGNVGYAFTEALAGLTRRSVVVLELSSFQLEDSPQFRPEIAVVLNISPNHLDRHGTLRRYVRAKENIFRNQSANDTVVLNYDDALVRAMARRARGQVVYFSKRPLSRGVYLEGDRAYWKDRFGRRALWKVSELQLSGAHNTENALAASAAAVLLGVPGAALARVLRTFCTLDHRIEPIDEIGGVRFVNDSKSTTVASTRAALEAVRGPIVLIAGGRDKGVDYAGIETDLERKVRAAVLYGEAAPKIASSWKRYGNYVIVKDFSDAVRVAHRSAVEGDAVLLSPMCTSYDQFGSFEERGETFRQVVAQIRALDCSRRAENGV